MFGADCTAQIVLHPSPNGFYTSGDVVSGSIELHATGMYSITDIQVKIRCDEYSVVTVMEQSEDKRAKRSKREVKRGFVGQLTRAAQQQALKQIGKAGNFDEDTMQIVGQGLKMIRERKKHYQLSANAFSTPRDEEKTMLSQGHHSYPFTLRLSEAIDKCPPHAPITTRDGLKVGVFWTLKTVVRRPRALQADLREVIRIPVYPRHPYSSHLDFSRRKRVTASSDFAHGREAIASLSFPDAGLPQDTRPLPLGLHLTAEGKYDVQRIKLILAQNCLSRAKGLKELHEFTLDLGTARVSQLVHGSKDLSSYLAALHMQDFIAPSISLSNISVSYELIVRIESSSPIEVRTPITVLSPVDTAKLPLVSQPVNNSENTAALPPYDGRSGVLSEAKKSDSIKPTPLPEKESAALSDIYASEETPPLPPRAPQYPPRPSQPPRPPRPSKVPLDTPSQSYDNDSSAAFKQDSKVKMSQDAPASHERLDWDPLQDKADNKPWSPNSEVQSAYSPKPDTSSSYSRDEATSGYLVFNRHYGLPSTHSSISNHPVSTISSEASQPFEATPSSYSVDPGSQDQGSSVYSQNRPSETSGSTAVPNDHIPVENLHLSSSNDETEHFPPSEAPPTYDEVVSFMSQR